MVKKANAIQTTDTSNSVKKNWLWQKINEIEKKITDNNYDKYFTTQEFNKLTVQIFAARLAEAILASKTDIADFVKKADFDDKLKNLNKKVTSNKTKHVPVENVEGVSKKGLKKDLINK